MTTAWAAAAAHVADLAKQKRDRAAQCSERDPYLAADLGKEAKALDDAEQSLRMQAHQAVTMDNEVAGRAIHALEDCLKLIDDMIRYVAKMSLRDYALLNNAPIDARRAIAVLSAFSRDEPEHVNGVAPAKN